jgi:hypothetical protein
MPTMWPFTDLLRLGSYVTNDLAHIRRSLAQLVTEIIIMSGALQAKIDQLKSDVAAEHDVNAAARKAIEGLAQQLKDAIEAGKSGDTDQMIADLESLHQALASDNSGLAAAIPANTSAAGGGTTVSTDPAAAPASASPPPDGTLPATATTPAGSSVPAPAGPVDDPTQTTTPPTNA